MSRRIPPRRALFIALIGATALAVLFGGAGVAYAYWSASGSGAASGGTGTTVPLVLTPATPTASLRPGSTSNVVLVATNSNIATVKVSTFALDTTQGTSGFSVDAAHSGCTLSALSFTTQSNGGAGWSVPGKIGSTNGTLSISLPGALAMSTGAANACQGATFTIYLVAS
jgi:hypothetical protein